MFIKMWINYTIKKIIIITLFSDFLLIYSMFYPYVIHNLSTICGFNYVNKRCVYNYVDNLDMVFSIFLLNNI